MVGELMGVNFNYNVATIEFTQYSGRRNPKVILDKFFMRQFEDRIMEYREFVPQWPKDEIVLAITFVSSTPTKPIYIPSYAELIIDLKRAIREELRLMTSN
jgi:hypothetical protein